MIDCSLAASRLQPPRQLRHCDVRCANVTLAIFLNSFAWARSCGRYHEPRFGRLQAAALRHEISDSPRRFVIALLARHSCCRSPGRRSLERSWRRHNAARLPLPGHGDAVRADGEAIRATVSAARVYSFADCRPAPGLSLWMRLGTASRAACAGVVASKATRHDVVMNVPPARPPGRGSGTAAAAVAQRASYQGLQAPNPACSRHRNPVRGRDIGWMNGTSREKAPSSTRSFSRLKSAST